jgi:uncharacterized protein
MTDGLVAFFVLACAITFSLDATVVVHWLRGDPPPEWALGLAGLGAFGPTLAATAVAWRLGRVRDVFRPWATSPGWVVLAFFTPLLLRLPATALAAALGEVPERWIQLPSKPEQVVALVVFSLGEEFGWRGFAQPRTIARWGPVVGPLVLGLGWAVWHAGMMVTPDGRVDWLQWALLFGMFPPCSVLCARLMERAGGSLWVALAFHAGGHFDNVGAAPADALWMRGFYVAVLWAVALSVRPAVGK